VRMNLFWALFRTTSAQVFASKNRQPPESLGFIGIQQAHLLRVSFENDSTNAAVSTQWRLTAAPIRYLEESGPSVEVGPSFRHLHTDHSDGTRPRYGNGQSGGQMNTTATRATDVAVNVANLTEELGKAKELVDDAIATGKHKAERLAKRATVAVDDCIVDTTYFIKKHPWQAVGVAAFIGTAAGLLVSLAFTPVCNHTKTN